MSHIATKSLLGVVRQRDGARILTDSGWYVDASGGQHALLFSHLHKNVLRDVKYFDDDLAGVNRYTESRRARELADWVETYDDNPGLDTFFVSGGTEAFEIAVSISQHVSKCVFGRDGGVIIGLRESYHGYSIAALNAGDHPVHKKRIQGALDFGWPILDRFSMTSAEEVTKSILRTVERYNAHSLILEPVGGTTCGAHVLPKDVLLAIRDACRKCGVTYIADEVITGFGRTGRPFCLSGNDFDIRISGKLLGGGIVPICAVSLSPTFAELLSRCSTPPQVRLTYSGNALAANVALNLQRVRERSDPLSVREKGDYLRTVLLDQLSSYGFSVRGEGMLLAVARSSDEPLVALQHVMSLGLRMGVLLMGGASVDRKSIHIMITPALDSTYSDLNTTADAVINVLKRAINA